MKLTRLPLPPAVISSALALFLSGYVIQQRTLRNLRQSIRPRQARPKPQIYLPEQFRTTKTLEDGTVVTIESEVERERREAMELQQHQQQVIEVTETRREDLERQQQKQPAPSSVESSEQQRPSKQLTAGKLAMLETLKNKASGKAWAVEHPDPLANNKVPVTRAERRRLIREEIQRLSRSNERVYYQRRLW